MFAKPVTLIMALMTAFALSSCSSLKSFTTSNAASQTELAAQNLETKSDRTTIWDALNYKSSEQPVKVNRFIWQASLDILDFMPVESVDPFSGLIVTGYGTPPGGTLSYRATVYVTDPALDARSLKLALFTKNGAAPKKIIGEIEDAILLRARQLHAQERKF